MNILFVCTGNTCRSPMAEGLCRAMAKSRRADVNVLSAGLSARPGDPPAAAAVAAVKPAADISEHQARPVSRELLEASDMIVVMTKTQQEMLQRLYPDGAERMITFRELAGQTGDIDDPFGQPQPVYDAVAKEMTSILTKAWESGKIK